MSHDLDLDLDLFYKAAGSGQSRDEFRSRLRPEDVLPLALAVIKDLPERLQLAETEADGGAPHAKETVVSVLGARCLLQQIANEYPDLSASLTTLDDQLDLAYGGDSSPIDLLTDQEYDSAVGGSSVDEKRWWGARKKANRQLPLSVLEKALRGGSLPAS